MTDRHLMEAVHAGDPTAIARLVEKYRLRILKFLIGRGETRDDALDLCQEVLARVCSRAASFNGVALSAWIFQVARNLQIDARRKRNFKLRELTTTEPEALAAAPASRGSHPELSMAQAEIRRRVEVAIQGLPPRQREVVELRLLGELTLEEIAETVGLTPGGVKSTLHNALANLRRSLADLKDMSHVDL
ncbi:MAG: sigma-70 family RNA polymerase sigma factor [Acidobacteriota bacterium]